MSEKFAYFNHFKRTTLPCFLIPEGTEGSEYMTYRYTRNKLYGLMIHIDEDEG